MRHPLSLLWLSAILTLVGVTATRLLAQTRDLPPEAAVAEHDELATVSDEPAAKQAVPLQALAANLAIFVLAIFVGFEVITKVPPTLHTPLMSGSNAISGITIVGAILVTGASRGGPAIAGMLAVALAAVNVVGGFLVTHRMLGMFRRK